MAKPTDQRTQAPATNTRWHTPSKPNFIKLRAGARVSGVFMCKHTTQYGPAYKFRDDKGEIFSLGGNRAQLDQIFDELLGNPQGFIGDTIIGHYLIVERGQDTESHSGRKVAQYQIGHVLDKCPKGCKS